MEKFWIIYGIDEFGEIIEPELFINEDKARIRRDELDKQYEYCARVNCEQVSPSDVNNKR